MEYRSEFIANHYLSRAISEAEMDIEKVLKYLNLFSNYIETKGLFFKTQSLEKTKLNELQTYFKGLSQMYETELSFHIKSGGKQNDKIGEKLGLCLTFCNNIINYLKSRQDISIISKLVFNSYSELYNTTNELLSIKKDQIVKNLSKKSA